MAPLALREKFNEKEKIEYTEKDAVDALYQKLYEGIQSMKTGKVYTVEEAWEEIDNI